EGLGVDDGGLLARMHLGLVAHPARVADVGQEAVKVGLGEAQPAALAPRFGEPALVGPGRRHPHQPHLRRPSGRANHRAGAPRSLVIATQASAQASARGSFGFLRHYSNEDRAAVRLSPAKTAVGTANCLAVWPPPRLTGSPG